MKKKRNWTKKAVILVVIAAAVLAYYLIPAVKGNVNQILRMFVSGEFTVGTDFVASYGA